MAAGSSDSARANSVLIGSAARSSVDVYKRQTESDRGAAADRDNTIRIGLVQRAQGQFGDLDRRVHRRLAEQPGGCLLYTSSMSEIIP